VCACANGLTYTLSPWLIKVKSKAILKCLGHVTGRVRLRNRPRKLTTSQPWQLIFIILNRINITYVVYSSLSIYIIFITWLLFKSKLYNPSFFIWWFNIDWLINWSYACQLIAMRIYLIFQARETSLDKNPSRTSLCSFYLLPSAKLAIFKDKQ
jgi:hypothetical protein